MENKIKVSVEEWIRLTHLADEYSSLGLDNGTKFINKDGSLDYIKILEIEQKRLVNSNLTT